jgi:ribosome recycling factor
MLFISLDIIMNDFESRLKAIIDWLTNEYSSIRTGQATPALIDGVKVESYGSMMPINQVASIGVEDARTIRVSPWDSQIVKSIETAIREADLGVSVVTDSSGLRIIFPELTGERRVQLLKLAKSKLEDARVSVRSARDEVMKEVEKQQKDGDISEDEKFAKKEDTQKKVDTANRSLDALYEKKELEINK